MKPAKLVIKAVAKHTAPNPTTRVGTIKEGIALSRYQGVSDARILTPEGSTKALEHQVGLQPTEGDYRDICTEYVHHSQGLQ